jgi:hypothetical protein
VRSSLLIGVIGSASYAVSSAFAIKLRRDLGVPIAAALAPAAALSAVLMANDLGVIAYTLSPIATVGVVLAVRRSVVEALTHAALLIGCALLLAPLNEPVDEVGSVAVVACVLLPTMYSIGDAVRQRISNSATAQIGIDARMWWLLQAVLGCASGLTVLVVDRLGWPAFVAMVGVLVLTKREFESYGASRTAYQQTLRALDRLAGNPSPRS